MKFDVNVIATKPNLPPENVILFTCYQPSFSYVVEIEAIVNEFLVGTHPERPTVFEHPE